MKRTLPALYLPQSPLVMVLGQLRFSPVAAIETYVPQIQDELRKKGLPEFRPDEVQEVTWNVMPGGPPSANVRTFKRWEFSDRSQQWLVVLTTDALSIATSAYDKYDDSFSRYLEIAIGAVQRHAEPETVTRAGLRYVDLIRPEAGLAFKDYLQEPLLGLEPTSVGMREGFAYSQLRGTTDIGIMMIRCVFSADGQVLPPDLRGTNLALQTQAVAGEKIAILDLDHFRSGEFPFTVQSTSDALGDLHDALDRAFRKSVTTSAIDRWRKPREAKTARSA